MKMSLRKSDAHRINQPSAKLAVYLCVCVYYFVWQTFAVPASGGCSVFGNELDGVCLSV